VFLICGIVGLGVAPSRVLDTISASVANMNPAADTQTVLAVGTAPGVTASHLPEWSATVPIGRNQQ
jgi:hypothetical protein